MATARVWGSSGGTSRAERDSGEKISHVPPTLVAITATPAAHQVLELQCKVCRCWRSGQGRLTTARPAVVYTSQIRTQRRSEARGSGPVGMNSWPTKPSKPVSTMAFITAG